MARDISLSEPSVSSFIVEFGHNKWGESTVILFAFVNNM